MAVMKALDEYIIFYYSNPSKSINYDITCTLATGKDAFTEISALKPGKFEFTPKTP